MNGNFPAFRNIYPRSPNDRNMMKKQQEKKIAHTMVVRCARTGKDFGIRWEQSGPAEWTATWSYKIPSLNNRQGSAAANVRLTGRFIFPDEYKGCPYCQGRNIVHCLVCHHIFCPTVVRGMQTTCPWCNRVLILDGERLEFPGNTDR